MDKVEQRIAFMEGYVDKEASWTDMITKPMGLALIAPSIGGALGGYYSSHLTDPTDEDLEAEQVKLSRHEWEEALATLKESMRRKQSEKETGNGNKRERGIIL